MENKPKVRIHPVWLDAMVPADWLLVAEKLAALATEYKVPADKMRMFINASYQMPMPLLVAMELLIKGEIQLVFENADTAHEHK